MNNKTIVYSLCNIGIKVAASEEIHKKLKKFMNYPNASLLSKYSIRIIDNFNKDIVIKTFNEKISQNSNLKQFKLKFFTYLYDKDQRICYAFNSNIVGQIDYNSNTTIWYLCDSNYVGRNLFHILILDPMSLMLPELNRIVFHGAALEVNGNGILLLGHSGAGKSTISHKISQVFHNSAKLCDDTFILEVKKEIVLYPLDTGEGYNIEIAKKLYDTGRYENLFYDPDKRKQYIIKKQNCKLDKPIIVKKILFLDRKEDYTTLKNTNITKCNTGKNLINIVNSQTNILTPYAEYKFNLYKQISKEIEGYRVEYNIDCDVLKFKEEGVI